MPTRKRSDVARFSKNNRTIRKWRKSLTSNQRSFYSARASQLCFERILKPINGSKYRSKGEEILFELEEKLKREELENDWTDSQIQSFLKEILEAIQGKPELFEKPSSKTFYNKIKAKSLILKSKSWEVLKYRMCLMKTIYFFIAMEKEKQLKETRGYANAEMLTDDLYEICPYWDTLDVMFKHQTDKPTVVYEHVEACIGDDGDNNLNECDQIELKFEVESRCGTPQPES
ncbi:uncharacterized protein [Eurosta solidaginis]|uniref:uncharacterized protein isoform X1 n=1 Tax=Eurosta solidaginis TaxID=178769 RepID=UPI0035306826